MRRVVVTGATGFIGLELVMTLATHGDYDVVAASREPTIWNSSSITPALIPELSGQAPGAEYAKALAGADAVVHLAGATPDRRVSKDTNALISTNVHGVEQLAQAAISVGVRKFIFISSSHVCGLLSGHSPINEATKPAPATPYAISKLMAEQTLIRVTRNTAMSWTIIRPPLVYGPGVHGSLDRLARMIVSGIPLPFGAVASNKRDMIGVRNLCSFISNCLTDSRADGERFVVRDGTPISTCSLIEQMGTAAGRDARNLKVPQALLAVAGKFSEPVARLMGDHRIDDTKARSQLSWQPIYPAQFDLERMMKRIVEAREPSTTLRVKL